MFVKIKFLSSQLKRNYLIFLKFKVSQFFVECGEKMFSKIFEYELATKRYYIILVKILDEL